MSSISVISNRFPVYSLNGVCALTGHVNPIRVFVNEFEHRDSVTKDIDATTTSV